MSYNIDSKSFRKFINSNELVVVDFWAPWCGPCRMLGPVLEGVGEKLGIKVGKVNIDNESEIAEAFNIQSIPAIYLFKNGKILDAKVGFMPANMLESWINSFK